MKPTADNIGMWRSVESREIMRYENSDNGSLAENSAEFSKEANDITKNVVNKTINHNLNRKRFLQIMGASMGVAGLNCVREPMEKIVPYVIRPPEAQPGMPTYYATVKVDSTGVTPMLVKTREGKAIKVEGHEDHPLYKGAMTADAHATIWELYDPDRLRTSQVAANGKLVDEATESVLNKAAEALNGAKNVRVLSGPSFSPTENNIKSKFLARGNNRKQVVYDALGDIGDLQAAQGAAYGQALVPQYRFDKADLILSLEADFLGTWIAPALFTKQYSSRRNPDGKMTRLVTAEAMMSVTGGNSDQRIPLKAGTQNAFAMGLASLLLKSSSFGLPSAVRSRIDAYTPQKTAEITGVNPEVLAALADELNRNKGRSLVVAGGASVRGGSGDTAKLGALLNAILNNDGKTVISSVPLFKADISSHSELKGLVKELKSGKVDVLVLDRVNPAFDLPANSEIAEAISQANTVIAIATHIDESSQKADLVIAASHFLEAWGDAYYSGYYSVSQPAITPLFDTISSDEAWMKLTGLGGEHREYVQSVAANYLTGSLGRAWDNTVKNGYFVSKATPNSHAGRRFNAGALNGISETPKSGGAFSLNLIATVQMGDGRNANNKFRHELPDPVTKICYDNYAAISAEDAKANNWKMGDILEVSNANGSIKLPVFIQPGMVNGSMAIPVGYGHEALGKVAAGLGANAMKLASFDASGITFSGLQVKAAKVDDGYRIATTQRHHEMHGRNLARYASLAEYKKDHHAGNHSHKLPGKGLYPTHDYSVDSDAPGYKWGMSIDLSKCTGCSSCVLSCYSENNIPTTSRAEVWRGREMNWMRIDRYYEGDPAKPETISAHFQPLMCQHCEAAPCENVCPTAATNHSHEGLNDMAYNRCIGTRYCSANCPYKVRRFNYFENWYGKVEEPMQMALNPDVTVRGRGVIEKCSMCVQRINEQRQMARAEGRQVDEADLKTACQVGCPADAITFGDLGDKETTASKNAANARAYTILDELLTKPRIRYMTKIMNKG